MTPSDPSVGGTFYPETCHRASLTRRQLLAGGTALLTASAIASAGARAGDDGTAVIRRYASLPDDPWAVCHGIRGMGRDFAMKSGGRAVDWLLETQLAVLPANGSSALGFPIQVEVHPNMFLKTLLEAGVPLDHGFTHQGNRRTLRDVLEGARGLFRPSQVIGDANALPWILIAFARTAPPRRGRWTNTWGSPWTSTPSWKARSGCTSGHRSRCCMRCARTGRRRRR